MKHNKSLFILTLLLCLTLIIIPVNGAPQPNKIVFSGTGKYLEPVHGSGRNYTWVISGRIYGDFNGKVTWYEEGYQTNIVGEEFSAYEGWVNGTIETNDGTLYKYTLGNKSGKPYTYQCVAADNPAECRLDPHKCHNRIIRVTGELYINGEYVEYYDEYGLGVPGQFIIPY